MAVVPVIQKEFFLTPTSGNAIEQLTDATDYTQYGLLNSDVKGNFLITSPAGMIHNGLSWSTPDINFAASDDNFQIQPPLDNSGVPQMGSYGHTYTIQITRAIAGLSQIDGWFAITGDFSSITPQTGRITIVGSTGNNGTYTLEQTLFSSGQTLFYVSEAISSAVADGNLQFYLTFPAQSYSFYWCAPSVEIDVIYDCINTRLQSRDNSTYEITYTGVYESLSPTSSSRLHTIKYPAGIKPTQPADIVSAAVTVITPDLYTKTFTSLINTELVYTLPSGLLVNYTASATQETEVVCNNDLCEVSGCVFNAIDEYVASIGTNPINTQTRQQTFGRMIGYSMEYLLAQQCGNVDKQAQAIADLRATARTTDCGCGITSSDTTPQKIVGYNSISSGAVGTYLLTSSGNGITVTQILVGNDIEWEVSLDYATIIPNLTASNAEEIAGAITTKVSTPGGRTLWFNARIAALGNSKILETDGGGLLIGATKNTAYNKNFGTTTADVPAIGSTLSGPGVAFLDALGKLTPTGTLPLPSNIKYSNFTAVPNPNNTGLNTLHSYSLPGDTMNVDGDTLIITAFGRITLASGTWSFNISFGSYDFLSVFAFAPTPSILAQVQVVIYVVRTGAHTQQIYGIALGGINFSGVQLLQVPTAGGEIMANPITIATRAQTNPANTNLQSLGMTVQLIKA